MSGSIVHRSRTSCSRTAVVFLYYIHSFVGRKNIESGSIRRRTIIVVERLLHRLVLFSFVDNAHTCNIVYTEYISLCLRYIHSIVRHIFFCVNIITLPRFFSDFLRIKNELSVLVSLFGKFRRFLRTYVKSVYRHIVSERTVFVSRELISEVSTVHRLVDKINCTGIARIFYVKHTNVCVLSVRSSSLFLVRGKSLEIYVYIHLQKDCNYYKSEKQDTVCDKTYHIHFAEGKRIQEYRCNRTASRNRIAKARLYIFAPTCARIFVRTDYVSKSHHQDNYGKIKKHYFDSLFYFEIASSQKPQKRKS